METTQPTHEVFLTKDVHPVTGSYFGVIKMNQNAPGLPTGGTTLDAMIENATSFGALYHQVSREQVIVTVLDRATPIEVPEPRREGSRKALTCVC